MEGLGLRCTDEFEALALAALSFEALIFWNAIPNNHFPCCGGLDSISISIWC